jgi:hypothetical protein
MKRFIFSPFNSAVGTTATTMILMGLIVGNTNMYLVANAQLFVGCVDNVDAATGAETDFCIYNTPSPFIVDLTDGTSVSFGTESTVFTECLSNVTKSLETCTCFVVVNPSDPVAPSDFCSSCDIQILTDTEFLPYFDCSNRLVGDCVGFDATTGVCIDNTGSIPPAPAPVSVPISSQNPVGTTIPRPVLMTTPTAPPLPSTPFPNTASSAPFLLPNITTEGKTNLIAGIAIGAGGGLALAALIAFCMIMKKYQQRGENNETIRNHRKTTKGGHISEFNDNDNTTTTPSPTTTLLNPTVEYPNNTINEAYDAIDPRNNGNDVDGTVADMMSKRHGNIPVPLAPTISSPSSSPSSTQPPSYPSNDTLHFKDQCRIVPPSPVAVHASALPAAALVAIEGNPDTSSTVIPFAVAVDVNTVSIIGTSLN